MSLLTAIALGILLAASPARAQTMRGHVTDRSTRQPVSGATIALINGDNRTVASAVSDDAGAFSVAASAGEYRISVQRLGYATVLQGPIRLRENGFAALDIAMQPEAIPVDSISVSVAQMEEGLKRVGFYDRKKGGLGQFLDRPFIEKRAGGRMENVLSGLPGVRLITEDKLDVQLRGAAVGRFTEGPNGTKICLPLIWVDGLLLADGKELGNGRMDLAQLAPDDLAGVEIFSGEASVPLAYARGGGACGAILFWSRQGVMKKKE